MSGALPDPVKLARENQSCTMCCAISPNIWEFSAIIEGELISLCGKEQTKKAYVIIMYFCPSPAHLTSKVSLLFSLSLKQCAINVSKLYLRAKVLLSQAGHLQMHLGYKVDKTIWICLQLLWSCPPEQDQMTETEQV